LLVPVLRIPEIRLEYLMNLRVLVGLSAVIAPLLHSLSDLIEFSQGGFSTGQLWLNYIAFLPMSWLLLGIYAVQKDPEPGLPALAGALLYGSAFTYFSHTTLLALEQHVATYEALWSGLGITYTIHGALMVCGGLMFAISALSARWLPKAPLLLFISGLTFNLVLALLPVPDLFQIAGSAMRNIGLMAMGYSILARQPGAEV
jgi:hypothetical protein